MSGIGNLRHVGLLAVALLVDCTKSTPVAAPAPSGIRTFPPGPPVVEPLRHPSATRVPVAVAVKTPAQVAIGVVPPPRPSATPRPAKVHPPAIYAVRLSKTDIGEGDYVTGDIITSHNVTSVYALIIGQKVPLPRKSSGHFILYFTTPAFPWFLKGNQSVDFLAKTADGASVKRTVTFHVH